MLEPSGRETDDPVKDDGDGKEEASRDDGKEKEA